MLSVTSAATANLLSIQRRCSVAIFRRGSIKMSSNPNQIVEHVVLFKVKPEADAAAVEAMLTNLNSLSSLDSVLHLSAGPVSRCRSKLLTFTHMLHSRYASKSDLNSYAVHPSHVDVVNNYVKPVVQDLMAVDWVADDLSGSPAISSGSVLRLNLLKLKEGISEGEKDAVFGVVRGIREKFASIEQLSVGENFSPGRAKGFSVCSIAVFNGEKELEKLDLEQDLANEEKNKVREFLDGVLVLDYTVAPSPVPANL